MAMHTATFNPGESVLSRTMRDMGHINADGIGQGVCAVFAYYGVIRWPLRAIGNLG